MSIFHFGLLFSSFSAVVRLFMSDPSNGFDMNANHQPVIYQDKLHMSYVCVCVCLKVFKWLYLLVIYNDGKANSVRMMKALIFASM